jgi:hypothetical protein
MGCVVLTGSRHMFVVYDGQDEDDTYLDIIQSPGHSNLKKQFKVRRMICRVCNLKFRSRGEIQAHLKREHRRIQTISIKY